MIRKERKKIRPLTSLSLGPKNWSEEMALAVPNLSRAILAVVTSFDADGIADFDGFDDLEWLEEFVSKKINEKKLTHLSIVSISQEDCLAGFLGPKEEKKSSESSVRL